MLLLEHPSSASSQVQVRVHYHSLLTFPSPYSTSAAAANAPLNPPSAPAATILAPRNARSSASPIHSRGASSPGRLSSSTSAFRNSFFVCALKQFAASAPKHPTSLYMSSSHTSRLGTPSHAGAASATTAAALSHVNGSPIRGRQMGHAARFDW